MAICIHFGAEERERKGQQSEMGEPASGDWWCCHGWLDPMLWSVCQNHFHHVVKHSESVSDKGYTLNHVCTRKASAPITVQMLSPSIMDNGHVYMDSNIWILTRLSLNKTLPCKGQFMITITWIRSYSEWAIMRIGQSIPILVALCRHVYT